MQEIYCPICGKVHTSIPYKCECGYEEVKLKLKDYRDYEKKVIFYL